MSFLRIRERVGRMSRVFRAECIFLQYRFAGLNNCNLFVTDITIYSRCTAPGRKTLPLMPLPIGAISFYRTPRWKSCDVENPTLHKNNIPSLVVPFIPPFSFVPFLIWNVDVYIDSCFIPFQIPRRSQRLPFSFSFWVPSRFSHSSDILFTKRGNICSYAWP